MFGALVFDHLLLDADKHVLHSVGRVPLDKHRELLGVNLAGRLVHRGDVDLRVEVHSGLLRGVGLSSRDSQEVDLAVEGRVGRADDRAVPVGEGLVIGFVETVGDRLVRKLAFLTLFKLLVEPESSWHYKIG